MLRDWGGWSLRMSRALTIRRRRRRTLLRLLALLGCNGLEISRVCRRKAARERAKRLGVP